MPLAPLGLAFNEHPERTVSVENALNMQPEFSNGGRAQIILRSCPGLADFRELGNETECRGLAFTGEFIYAVVGRFLYSITEQKVVTEIGRIDGEGPVGIRASGEQVLIASDVKNYVYTIATQQLELETDAPNGRTVAFLNSRFVMEDPDATGDSAGRFYWSNVLDAKTWNALDFATAEQKPDRILRLQENNGRLVLMGVETLEFWRSDAQGFVPITGTTQSIGIAGRFAAAEIDNTVCFLASDGTVRVLNGYQAVRVSTTAVEAALNADSATECIAYTEQGHTIFEFSTSERTLCYDLRQSQLLGRNVWFEKSTGGTRHAVSAVIRAFGLNIVGTKGSGSLFTLSRSVYPDVREFVVPTIANDQTRSWNKLKSLELICRTGTGAVPDIQPQVMMQVSRDNGHTWGEEKWRDMGTLGDYDKRIRWNRLGRFLQFSPRFRVTGQVEFTVTGLNANGSR